jgi:hypothetical protein
MPDAMGHGQGCVATHVAADSCVDERLLATFLALSRVTNIDDESLRLLRAAYGLLARICKSPDNICSCLAHASAYFSDLAFSVGPFSGDLGQLGVVALFLAHSYVLDSNLPLSRWRNALLRDRVTLTALNDELLRAMQMRGFVLRVADLDLQTRYETLGHCCLGN